MDGQVTGGGCWVAQGAQDLAWISHFWFPEAIKNRDKREHTDFSRARNNGHKILRWRDDDLRDSKTLCTNDAGII